MNIRDLESTYEEMEKLYYELRNPKKVDVIVKNVEGYMYGHREIDKKEIYVLDDEIREILKEFLEYALSVEDEELIRVAKIFRALPHILLKYEKKKKKKPVRTYEDHGGEDSAWYKTEIMKYVVETPYLLVHTYTRYSFKYSTYLGPFREVRWMFEWFKDTDLFDKIDAAVKEIKEFCQDVNEKKIRGLLESGYEARKVKGEIAIRVGHTSTSVADWEGDYVVLCGEVNLMSEEIIDDNWGIVKKVTLKPTTKAIVKYKSWGTLGSWKAKTLYLLEP